MFKLIKNNKIITVLFFIYLCLTSSKALAIGIAETSTISTQVVPHPLIISDVKVEDITDRSANFYWKTDRSAKCVLFWGITSSYTDSRDEITYSKDHFLYIGEFSPETLYHYKIYCIDELTGVSASTDDDNFETLPSEEVPAVTKIKDQVLIIEEEIKEEAKEITKELPKEFEKIISEAKNLWEILAESPILQGANVPIAVSVAVAAALASILPAIVNLQLLTFWDSIYSWFLYLFGWARRRRYWGIVYDAETDKPIPLVSVQIYSAEFKRLLATQLTDKDGRFGFLVNPGKYYLVVIKSNYQFPSKILKIDYHKEILEVKKEGVIQVNIPMDPDMPKLTRRISILNYLSNALDKIRLPLMILGTCINIIITSYFPSLFNYVILVIYLFFWILELYQQKSAKTHGEVYERVPQKPLDLSIIRVYDKNTGKIVATKVSDAKGKYFYLVNPGEYSIKATKSDYQQTEVKNIKYRRGEIMTKDISMNKLKT